MSDTSPLLAVHYAWIDGYATQAPVGVWNEIGDSFYPPEHIDEKAKGASVITYPHQMSWADWLDEKTYATSAYGANWAVVASAQPLQVVFEEIRHDFLTSDPPTEPLLLPPAEDETAGSEPEQLDADEPIPWGHIKPAARFEIERSWWIAAELVRRHPELAVLELHPGDGLGDVLSVRTTATPGGGMTDIWINRGGSIRVHFHHSVSHIETVDVSSLSQAFEHNDPHAVVKGIERAARLQLSRQAPPSTPRTLALRVLANFLTMVLNDRHRWDVRNEVQDGSYGVTRRGYVQRFPGAEATLREATVLGLPEEPYTHAWALLRDDEPVALATLSGFLFVGSRAVPVQPEYEQTGRRITATTMRLLGEFLP